MQPSFQFCPDALGGISNRSRVGIDIVQVSRIEESLRQFGDRFMSRLYSAAEIAYAKSAPPLTTRRLAARFAAKEATLKALQLTDRGIDWRELEVSRSPTGECEMRLHGAAKRAAAEVGIRPIALSLTHEGDYAGAILIAESSSSICNDSDT